MIEGVLLMILPLWSAFIISIIGFFYINLPQNSWILIPSLCSYYCTFTALTQFPEYVFNVFGWRNRNPYSFILAPIVILLYFSNMMAGFMFLFGKIINVNSSGWGLVVLFISLVLSGRFTANTFGYYND